jgi:HD superfamily phosphohydrolase YqeK
LREPTRESLLEERIPRLSRRAAKLLARMVDAWRHRGRAPLDRGLPGWAQVGRKRRAHIRRVVVLLERWAEEMRVSPDERRRWIQAAWLHDALRDARLPDGAKHGPAAADRAAREGERDQGVLDAVRYHSVGYAGWDDVGRMLYLADNLEPGRRGRRKERARFVRQVPRDRDAVLREVVGRQIQADMRAGRAVDPLTMKFWNSLSPR